MDHLVSQGRKDLFSNNLEPKHISYFNIEHKHSLILFLFVFEKVVFLSLECYYLLHLCIFFLIMGYRYFCHSLDLSQS